MGLLVTLVIDFQPLTNVTKNSILGFAGVLDMPLRIMSVKHNVTKMLDIALDFLCVHGHGDINVLLDIYLLSKGQLPFLSSHL